MQNKYHKYLAYVMIFIKFLPLLCPIVLFSLNFRRDYPFVRSSFSYL